MPDSDTNLKIEDFDAEVLREEIQRRADTVADDTETVDRAESVGRTLQSPLSIEQFSTDQILQALRSQEKVIYGTDDRLDAYEVVDRRALTDMDSVVASISIGSISDNGDGTSTLQGQTLGERRNLCASEPFRDQPVISHCTGFLVDPSIVATAAHCINEGNLDNIRFVFGFEMHDADTPELIIDNDEIYSGTRILGREIGIEGTDWALVQLDKPVLNHAWVRVRRRGKIADGAATHVIGHPSGLPKKFAGGANVRDNSASRFFKANLDTYGGNSGSPVFNSTTHSVEGVLVRGETDYVSNGTCNVSNVCPTSGCSGEACTRTTEFASLIPHNEQDCIPFNPARAEVLQVRGRWKIVVGRMLLLDFASSRGEAEQALEIIKHYDLNGMCFVGRPHPSMTFFLSNGDAPAGALSGEDSIGFNRNQLQVKRIRDRWKLVEGNRWFMDFDQKEAEARQALSYILRYRFRRICYVGRPHPSMTYFRR